MSYIIHFGLDMNIVGTPCIKYISTPIASSIISPRFRYAPELTAVLFQKKGFIASPKLDITF